MVNTRVAQVSNVSAAATMEQLRTLFGFLGKIEDIRLFPKEDSVLPVTVRICFVRFQDPTSVGMAQHLSNTVFLDKALNVTPFPDGVIPEESRALQMVAASAGGLVSMISNAGTSLLPTPPQPLLGHLPGTISGVAVSTTSAGVMDQTFAALGVPQPPPLTNVDPTKVEEIRRTVYVGNLDSGTVTAEQLLNFFQKVGEVKYVRMAGDETQPTRFAFVEFTEQGSVAKALTYNSVMFAGRPLKINHSNNAIVKPPGKTQEAIQKELAETMKQVRDAQALIQAAIDPEIKAAADKNCTEDLEVGHVKEPRAPAVQSQIKGRGLVGDTEKKKRSKSRSPARRKSRSRSRRRSRSRSKEARRSRSRRSTSRTRRRSRSPRRRSPPPRRKSRSRSRHRRSRSKSKEHRSRSREKRRRSKTPPKSYRASRRSRSRSREKKEESSSKSRRRSRSPSKHRSRSKSRSGSPKRPSKHRKDKKRDRSKDRDRKEKEGRNSSSSSSSRKRKEKEQTEKEPVEAVEEKKEEKTDKADSKIKRDYDEEEKGFDSQEAAPVVKEEKEEEEEEEEEEEPEEEEEEEVDIVKTEDMDVDSD